MKNNNGYSPSQMAKKNWKSLLLYRQGFPIIIGTTQSLCWCRDIICCTFEF